MNIDIQGSRKYIFLQFQIMNQLPENSLCIYDVTFIVTSYLIGLGFIVHLQTAPKHTKKNPA